MSNDDIESQLEFTKSKSRRKLFLLVGLVAFVVVSSVAFYPSMMPAEVFALAMNYNEGEKMTYDLEMTMDMMGQNFSIQMIYRIEILEKEGETYTICTTIDTPLLNQSYSVTARINENGETVEFLDLPPEFQQTMASFSFIPGNGLYFPLKEASVGDSWQIPIDIRTEQFNFTGTINNKITEILSTNIPAGTYDLFKLEISSSDLTIRYKLPTLLNMTETAEIQISMEGYEYFEKGTCRVVKANFYMTTTTSMMGETMIFSMTIDMRLIDHIR